MNGNNKMLLDTNIVIYISKKIISVTAFATEDATLYISDITYMETLGYPFSSLAEKEAIELLLSKFKRIAISEKIIQATILLKQTQKIKLPDVIIAATALVHDLEVITRNEKDFRILGIVVSNPII
jgi:predicted nucleic acid-binding protein